MIETKVIEAVGAPAGAKLLLPLTNQAKKNQGIAGLGDVRQLHR